MVLDPSVSSLPVVPAVPLPPVVPAALVPDVAGSVPPQAPSPSMVSTKATGPNPHRAPSTVAIAPQSYPARPGPWPPIDVRRTAAPAPLLSFRPVLGASGRWLLAEVRRLVSYSALTVLVAASIWRRPGEGRGIVRVQIARQVVFSAWDAAPMVAFIAGLLSVSLVALSATLVPTFEANAVVGRVLALVLVRELAPLMTAILVILRSSGAVAVELGYMGWRGEIEALETLGIDPIKFVLLPRFVGLTAATVSMTLLFCAAAVSAGLLTANVFGAAPSLVVLRDNVGTYLLPTDLVIAFIKSLLFGGTIAAVSCYHGLSVREDLTEVPRRASRALVEALSWCTVVGVAITLITL